jgi:DNA polymerase III delta prime subunit
MAIEHMAGNDFAKTAMLSMARAQRGGASYVFAGEENTGKNFAALQFAKTLNCLAPKKNGDCCDECANCKTVAKVLGDLDERDFQKYAHQDLGYLNSEKAQFTVSVPWVKASSYTSFGGNEAKSGEVKVVDVFKEFNSMGLVSMKVKVLVMQDAERMNDTIANAILKELEEPAKTTVFILIVNNAEHLLGTITSRCKKVTIKRASEAEIEKVLRRVDPFIDEKTLRDAVAFSDGKIGDALRLEEIQKVISDAAGLFKSVASKEDNIEAIFDRVKYMESRYRQERDREEEKGMKGMSRLFVTDILKILAHIYSDMLQAALGLKEGFGAKYGIDESQVKPVKAGVINAVLKRIERAQRDLLSNANVGLLFTELLFNIRKEGLQK